MIIAKNSKRLLSLGSTYHQETIICYKVYLGCMGIYSLCFDMFKSNYFVYQIHYGILINDIFDKLFLDVLLVFYMFFYSIHREVVGI